jgi:2-methylcitrate dehydratase PrpD
MNGHPTVPVAPVAIGLAEALGSTGREALLAFIAGVETECRVGRLMGPSHYAKGWHATATFGTFGAMAAAAKLLKLDDEQTRHAFGLAGTQAAGLKSVFGTMSKPLHAGKAAQNGLLAARLASRGFTSDTEILDSDQGFAATQSTTVSREAALVDPSQLFYVTDALFKYHAACYLTHNAIEAAGTLRAANRFKADEVEAVRVHVNAGHMGVCNIAEPRTGLECKFSLRMTTALALSGEDTFQEALFSDATATRADLVGLRGRVSVIPDATGPGSTVEIALKDGRILAETVDVARPVRDLDAQQAQIERKFRHLAEPALGAPAAARIIEICRNLEAAPDLAGLLALCRP